MVKRALSIVPNNIPALTPTPQQRLMVKCLAIAGTPLDTIALCLSEEGAPIPASAVVEYFADELRTAEAELGALATAVVAKAIRAGNVKAANGYLKMLRAEKSKDWRR